MSDEFDDFGAPRRNAEECERAGATLRSALGGGDSDRMPPLMAMFEKARQNVPEAASLEIVVRSDEAMGDATAFAVTQDCEIHVGLSFAEEAMRDSAETRFNGIHELIHILFHKGAPRFFRKNAGNVLYPFLHDKHERVEWQADRISRAIFMPPAMAVLCADSLQLSKAAGVPFRQAAQRIKELGAGKQKSTPGDIALKIVTLSRDASRGKPEFGRQEAEVLKLQLWNALPTIEGEDKTMVRRCGSYQISWNEFGKTTGCGWFIENGQIVSFFASRSR